MAHPTSHHTRADNRLHPLFGGLHLLRCTLLLLLLLLLLPNVDNFQLFSMPFDEFTTALKMNSLWR
jgi:hypothetical protein